MSSHNRPDPFQTPTWERPESPGTANPAVLPTRWQLVRRLGAGGQADVWLAWDGQVSENCAVKIFRPGMDGIARERIRREVWLGRKLFHPRIVRVHELIELPDRLAVAMEWVPGGTLSSKLSLGPLSIEETIAVAGQVLEALQYLHGEKVLHRDIKPSNLLLDEKGNVMLADFGLARPLSPGVAVTVTADQIGTPGYMSPEQLRGDPPTEASDLYALGVTLFQCLSGKVPFDGTSAWEVARRQMQERAPSIRGKRKDCPAWLSEFIARLLEREPEDRFPSAAAAREALKWRRGLASPARRRRVLAWGAALLVLAATVAGGTWRLLRPPQAVRYQAEGKTVKGITENGAVLWTKTFPETVQQCETADIDGDGRPEGLVAAYEVALGHEANPQLSRATILGNDGNRVSEARPEALIKDWPFEFANLLFPRFALIDINDDGQPEVMLRAGHRSMHPSALFIYWPRERIWDPLILHAGHIVDVVRAPDSHPWNLYFLAFSNYLGHSLVAGELQVNRRMGQEKMVDIAPPVLSGFHFEPGDARHTASLRWYTPLCETPDDFGERTISTSPEGMTLKLVSSGAVYGLDLDGNPVTGPNAGRDLRRERLAFLSHLATFRAGRRVSGLESFEEKSVEVEASCRNVLQEVPYRIPFALAQARTLVQIGQSGRAADVLEVIRKESPCQDAEFMLAQVRAVRGELDEARTILERLIAKRTGGRAQLDAITALWAIYTETRDQSRMAASVLNSFAHNEAQTRKVIIQGALSRAHVFWDEPTQADAEAKSYAVIPEAGAMAVLARWRLGRLRPDELENIELLKRSFPESEFEFNTARAAVLLSQGRAGDAVREIEAWLPRLESAARDDFARKQISGLARAVYVHAIFTLDAKRGVQLAREVLPRLEKGLLPQILAATILQNGKDGIREWVSR